jgi:hypothetical protein
MEPANLNASSDDARLEALLRRPAAPLLDDGFSRRVLAALPPVTPQSLPEFSGAPWVVSLGGGIFGTAFAIVGVFLWPGVGSDLAHSIDGIVRNFAVLADPLFLLAVAITTVSLWYVFRQRLVVLR